MYSRPVSSGLRTDYPSTLLAWSSPSLASIPNRLVCTQVGGLFGPSRTSGAVARGLPFPGPLCRAASNPVACAECAPRLIPLVRPSANYTPGPLGDAFLV
ncbi:Protein SEY1 [Trichinella pseudospiralis]